MYEARANREEMERHADIVRVLRLVMSFWERLTWSLEHSSQSDDETANGAYASTLSTLSTDYAVDRVTSAIMDRGDFLGSTEDNAH